MDTASLVKRGNRALEVNPPNADIHLGRWGSDWGWVMFCIMGASTLGLLAWSFRMRRKRRAFHYLLAAALAVSTVSWYSQASDLGSTPITAQFLHHSARGSGVGGYPTRQIWYSRYVDWTLTTTLLLLSLLLITGLPLSIIFVTLFFNVLMVVCGLLGALTRTRYKWGYFVFACAALGYVLYHVFASGLRSARRLGKDFGRTYLYASVLLGIIWPMYAVCWGLSEGGNVIGISAEFLFYGILDIFSKPVFAFLLLSMLRRCDYGALRLRSGKRSEEDSDLHEPRRGLVEKDHERIGSADHHHIGGANTNAHAGLQGPANSTLPHGAQHTTMSPAP
ncbi:hypothetical protein PHSY_005824 [Pseudozyma hubeiensis SY62]|uniref:Uncharacterized protein n=1 Tax=Pseudozyma hubeiensis (strain SY62) TaxID=1305764 RepID=R9PJE3_PSEHS|nr:hypothetical protein PHSY_005824 [Pseudozyma hubeiensis SY62]GAC98235.1 hypothetical protein PHSY_005824 [Pseudozyma hubeiensis SY62]